MFPRNAVVAAFVVASLSVGCGGKPLNDKPEPTPEPEPKTSSPALVPSSPPPGPVTLTPVLVFPLQRSLDVTRHLSVEIGKRAAGSPGEVAAAKYIEAQLTAGGYEVVRQEFQRADGGQSVNIIARVTGADFSKGHIVVGGHFDTLGESPGGNDNGTGIGVLIALAGLISDQNLPIEFVAFAAEERHPVTNAHHEGSRAYVARLADRSAVKAMVSVDMVGNGPRVVIVRDNIRPEPLQGELAAVAADLGIPHLQTSAGEISDHTSFTRKGMPGVLVWSGKHSSVHTAEDTFRVVRPEAVDRAGRLLTEWIQRLYQLH